MAKVNKATLDKKFWQEKVAHMIRNGKPDEMILNNMTLQSIEKEIIDIQKRRWIIQIRPYRSEYNAVDGIMVTFINVTQLRLAEEARLKSQERLNEAMKISNIAWWEWDIPSQKVIFDPKKATMLGYTVEEFPDNVYAITELLHPEDYDATMAHMRAYLEGKTAEWNVLYRIKRRDGQYAWYHDRGKITARDHDGKPLKLIGTVVDPGSKHYLPQVSSAFSYRCCWQKADLLHPYRTSRRILLYDERA